MKPLSGTSPRALARMAGGLYLLNILAGAFAIGIVPAALVVSGDVAASLHNIQRNELLYRAGSRRAPDPDRVQRGPGGHAVRPVQGRG